MTTENKDDVVLEENHAPTVPIPTADFAGTLFRKGRQIFIAFDTFQSDEPHTYIPKKCSIFDIGSATNISTYYVGPPFPWEQLSREVRKTNAYISHQITGLNWFEGDLPYDRFLMALLNHAQSADEIYTKGKNCVRYLSGLFGRPVLDIEPLMATMPKAIIKQLRRDLPKMNCMFTYHERRFPFTPDHAKEYSCCQDRAFFYGHVIMHYLKSGDQKRINTVTEDTAV